MKGTILVVAIARIETLLSPEYVEGLESLPMADVRQRRDECQEAADVLSYLRRIVQGRFDLVHAEIDRRVSGGEGRDLSDMVEQLKRGEIIADSTRSPGNGRLPMNFGPADADGWITRELDEVFDAGQAGHLPDLPDEELRRIADALNELERKVSDQRNRLHERHDALQAEVVRRYKSGEATVDSLLS